MLIKCVLLNSVICPKNADMLMFGQHATCCISYLSEELFDKKKYSSPPPHKHERKKWTNFFLYLKRLLAVWARLMKCEPFWEYELKKVRYTSVWHDDQNNLKQLKACIYSHSMSACGTKHNNWTEIAPPSGRHCVFWDGGRPPQVKDKWFTKLKVKKHVPIWEKECVLPIQRS